MKDFLAVSDYTPEQPQNILDLALKLKSNWPKGGKAPLLEGRVPGTSLQEPSSHTNRLYKQKASVLRG